MIHNNLRFGLLYLSDNAAIQMLRHFSMLFPDQFPKAIKKVRNSDVWERKSFLEKTLKFRFNWFVNFFNLKDQVNQDILI